MEETKTFSADVKIQMIDDYGKVILKMLDIFGDAEVVKMLRATARVVASGKAK